MIECTVTETGAISDDQEIAVGEREAGVQLGKLDGGRPSVPIDIVHQRAGRGVVDDAIARIGRRRTEPERGGRQHPGRQRREHRVVEMEDVVGHVEIGDLVDIVGGVERRVEDEGVRPVCAGQRVVAVAAQQRVVAAAAQQRVDAVAAIEPVVAGLAAQHILPSMP